MIAVADEPLDSPLDEGPHLRGPARERTCIVTRQTGAPDTMIRFVVGPDGDVVPDLKGRLPGRGAWVMAQGTVLAQALKRRSFAKAFKREVTVDLDLVARVNHLIEVQALGALSLANKAGGVITGFSKVEGAIAGKPVVALIHANDGGSDGSRKLGQALRRRHGDGLDDIPVVSLFTSLQLDLAMGRMNVVHAALLAGSASENFLARCTALAMFRSGMTPETPLATPAGEPNSRPH